jgi:hypothetical protein
MPMPRVARRRWLCAAAPALLAALSAGGAWAQAVDVEGMIEQSKQALAEHRMTAAVDHAREATEAAPDSFAAWAAMAQACAARADRGRQDQERAVEAICHCAAIDPAANLGPALRQLCFEGEPLRWVPQVGIEALPTEPRVESVSVVDANDRLGGQKTFSIAATTALIFPRQVPLTHPVYGGQFSRVAYGYVTDANDPGGPLYERVRVYYPSATQSAAGRDYRDTASNALSVILRLFCYRAVLANGAPADADGGPLEVWLMEGKETGAEQRRSEVILFGIDQERTPLAWVREICHEFGHYSLPPIGPFTEPEPWANGLIGEYLYADWLREHHDHGLVPWGGEMVDLREFLNRSGGTLVQGFYAGVPDGNRLTDTGMAGVNHALGLALYTNLVLGPAGFARATALMPKSTALPDLMTGVARAFEERDGPIRLPARIHSQPESQLDHGVDYCDYESGTLAVPGAQRVVYWVYLSRGPWSIALSFEAMPETAGPTTIQVAAEGRSPSNVLLEVAPGQRIAAGSLGPKAAGWYRLVVQHDNRAVPLLLDHLVLAKDRSEAP